MTETEQIERFAEREYEHGWTADIEMDAAPKGLSEDVVRLISEKKDEPDWLLEWRLDAYRRWQEMEEPDWANIEFEPIDYQDIIYYASPKHQDAGPDSLEDVDPELREMWDRLGISLEEQKALAGVAVDAVVDSVSVATTYQEKLADLGIIFCSMQEAIREHPDLVKEYLGSVVPRTDNKHAALNAAVFSDGSFCYIPPNTTCPVPLSTYFRINMADAGQFERTLIIADEGAEVDYMEGCTAPMRDDHQLHAAVVEIVAHEDATVNYSTVQNWYPGDEEGRGGVYNFVTKRGKALGDRSTITWTQVETGSAITWKYPSCLLIGDGSRGEFYNVTLTTHHQQADTGTKMVHIGKDTTSTIISKSISADEAQNSYRGLVDIKGGAHGARNFSQCDSMLLGSECGAHTFPYIDVDNPDAQMEHEATTTKIGEDQLFYLAQRGIEEDDAVNLIVNGFSKEVLDRLPTEFAVEARDLLGIKLEESVG